MKNRSSLVGLLGSVMVLGLVPLALGACRGSKRSPDADEGGTAVVTGASAASSGSPVVASAAAPAANSAALMAADLELATNTAYANAVAKKADGSAQQLAFFTDLSTSLGVFASARFSRVLTEVWTDDEKMKKFAPPGKDRSAFLGVMAALTHVLGTGQLPQALGESFERYLAAQANKPRLGLWNPKKAGPSLDVTSLAVFAHPDNSAYLREMLKSHGREGGSYAWELERSARKEKLAYLGNEEAALMRLKSIAPSLTPEEQKRLDALRASKLGDEEPVEVTQKELVEAYLANELRGDEKYKGKVVRISAEVRDIKKSPLGKPYLILGGTLGLHGAVHCQLNEAFVSEATALNPHDSVTVSGKVVGLVVGNVLVDSCEL